jgi:hypothetical protein
LILLLELLLVEYLYSEDAIIRGAPVNYQYQCPILAAVPACSQVEGLVPIRIQGSLDDCRGFGLLATQSRDGKRIWKTWEWLSVWVRSSGILDDAYGRHHACRAHQQQLLQDISIL